MARNDLDETTLPGEDPSALDVVEYIVTEPKRRNHPVRTRIAVDGRIMRSLPERVEEWEEFHLDNDEIARIIVLYARRLKRLQVLAQTAITEREAIAAALVTARQERQALAAAVATLKQRIDDAGIP